MPKTSLPIALLSVAKRRIPSRAGEMMLQRMHIFMASSTSLLAAGWCHSPGWVTFRKLEIGNTLAGNHVAQ
jgi:hypothetical protein